jgi:hypothetical protein
MDVELLSETLYSFNHNEVMQNVQNTCLITLRHHKPTNLPDDDIFASLITKLKIKYRAISRI